MQEKFTTLLTIGIIIAFFMPWITVESAAIEGITQLLTGKSQVLLDSVSGFKIPLLANSKDSRFMISVIKIFNPNIRNADKKSYLVWGVPLIGILIYLAGRVFKKVRIIRFFLGFISMAFVCGVVYKITATDLDKLVLRVNIAPGLWITLACFVFMGVSEFASFMSLQKDPLEEASALPPGQKPSP